MVKKKWTKKWYIKKWYDKKENGKNATGRPNKWETPEQLEKLIYDYFNSISITRPVFVEKNIPEKEKTDYEVIKHFFKYEAEEWDDNEADDSDEEDIMTETKPEKKRKRIYYKTVRVPVVNNLWEQVYEDHWFKEPTVTWLAIYLWTSRDVIIDYEKDKKFSDTLKKAKSMIERKYEERMINGWGAWSIFALKNFWRKDNRSIELKPPEDEDDSDKLSEEEILEKLKKVRLEKKSKQK